MGCFAKIENGTLIKLLTREKLNTGPACKEYYRNSMSYQRLSGGMKVREYVNTVMIGLSDNDWRVRPWPSVPWKE